MWKTKGTSMADDKILATLILDKDMIVTDRSCTGATLIAQMTDGYFIFAMSPDGTCALGFEGENPVSIDIHDLLELAKGKHPGTMQ